ncbi:hypothetical protein SEA_DUMPTRUCK_30 [Gordonia phage DumpTruck]|nr:hypothetical protein SEA_DUMPTRUCK_30 [Gordonia phage DumpTruck]
MIEQVTVEWETLPGMKMRLTRGHEEFGDDFITAEFFDANLNKIASAGGGFRGPGPQPVIVEPASEPQTPAPEPGIIYLGDDNGEVKDPEEVTEDQILYAGEDNDQSA